MTPLHIASQDGQVAMAQLRIECRAKILSVDSAGMTPLHIAS